MQGLARGEHAGGGRVALTFPCGPPERDVRGSAVVAGDAQSHRATTAARDAGAALERRDASGVAPAILADVQHSADKAGGDGREREVDVQSLLREGGGE